MQIAPTPALALERQRQLRQEAADERIVRTPRAPQRGAPGTRRAGSLRDRLEHAVAIAIGRPPVEPLTRT